MMEKKMNRLKNILALGVFSLVVLALPAVASAQYNRNDPYYGNGSYGNNNGYYGDIRGTLQNLKSQALQLDRAADRTRGNGRYGNYGGYGNSNDLRRLTSRFKDAANDLAGAYGRGRNMRNSEDEARRVLDLGSQLDNEIYRSGGNLQYQWNSVQNDLRIIANAYNLNYNNRGRYNNRNRNSGNWRNRIPFPLPF